MFTDLDVAIAISRRMSNICGATLRVVKPQAQGEYRLTVAIRHIRKS